MTLWPWMKNVDAALVETPIDPVDEFDQRPAVADLIVKKRAKIDKIRAGVIDDPLFDADKHDDLFLLRFFLSHNKSAAAISAVKECLAFRNKHKFDEKDIRDCPPNKVQSDPVATYFGFSEADTESFVVPDPRRGPISFTRFRKFRLDKMLVEKMSMEDRIASLAYINEWAFQNADFVTRTTGRLTKKVRILDFEGFTMGMFSLEAIRLQSEASGVLENMYPQLVDSIIACNTSAWIQTPWRILRPLMPKRVVSKVDFINPCGNEKERRRLLKHISEDKLHVSYGGKNQVNPME